MDRLSVQTELLTLEKVFNGGYQFSIPSYQRPYVWSDDDVLLLFTDIKNACARYHLSEKKEDKHYFIGTILSSKINQSTGIVYELIDGQQRTTTLMLIALAFKAVGINSNLKELAVYQLEGGEAMPRLQFAIRDQVQQLLGGLAGLKGYEKPSQEVIDNNEYLKQIGIALKVLSEQIEKLDINKAEKLGQYFYSNVQWVNNMVPAKMDLNRLFATMNTAGVQLEQADILKAKLFKHIKTDKAQYDAMWVACEHMDNYFERNVRKVFPDAKWDSIEPDNLAVFDKKVFSHPEPQQQSDDENGFSIDELSQMLASGKAPDSVKQQAFETYDLDVETTYCRSIIKFPLFLIHAYRVYLAINDELDIEPRLHSDRLLEIFTPLIESKEETVKSFIEVLWQVRYQFDAWVVKWVKRDDDDSSEFYLGLTSQSPSPSKNTQYINRSPKETNALALLQSVRNFTGERSAQYWLTSFIAKLIKKKIGIKADREALIHLETIDNLMSLATCSQKEASFKQASLIKPKRIKWEEQKEYFTEAKGTGFEHYWFQKLEYLLWKEIDSARFKLKADDLDKFKEFRITSKNSVEHVYPQHEEHQNKLERDFLDAFGNLVLLSPGENSSYSNQAVKKKLVDFEVKPQYDSLKLKAMFKLLKEQNDWQEDQIKQHQKEMLSTLAMHYDEKEH